MKNSANLFMLYTTLIICCGCTKAYQPPETTNDYNYLVVEGTINTAPDSTMIKLSRSVKLPQGTNTRPELKAVVTIEDQANNSFALTERTNGYYFVPALNLINTQNYRLRIKTADGKTYLSDYVPVKIVPPIDSVGYTITSGGINIYCNTHDPANNTHYYRWDYQETWEYAPDFISYYISDGTQLLHRTDSQFIYRCWRGDNSANIAIGTSTQLTNDVIYQAAITSIPSNSPKIVTEYSILLRQYALTKDAYQFWQNIKVNTEDLGSIFDAQPSVLKGNIHNITDANEPVIGFVSVGSIQTKRIFITRNILPSQWAATITPDGCSMTSALFKDPVTGLDDVGIYLIPLSSAYQALIPIMDPGSPVIKGYTETTTPCTNCTANGGTKIQPAFWK